MLINNFQHRSRRNHRRCSIKKSVLRNFAKFLGIHLCQSLFFIKVAGLKPANLFKKRLWHMCFTVNFAKFLRTAFYRTTSDDCFCRPSYFLVLYSLDFIIFVSKHTVGSNTYSSLPNRRVSRNKRGSGKD